MADQQRTLAEIVIEALTTAPEGVPMVYVHENLIKIRVVSVRVRGGGRKRTGVELTLGIPDGLITPDDALWFARETNEGYENRKPKYIGMLVMVPMAVHERKETA